MARLFTLPEARALLPVLRPLLIELRTQKRQLSEQERELQELTRRARGNGQNLEPKIAAARKATNASMLALRKTISQVTALGVEIKDLDMALVDFPSDRDGTVVYLCWHVDEDDIGFWHETTTGFTNRKPL